MDKIKKGLGRGLSSLIGETKVEPQKNQVSISDLVPNKYQPRKIFDEASLEDLTNSIKERGMIQPIIVRNSNKNISKFEVIAPFSGIVDEVNVKVGEMASPTIPSFRILNESEYFLSVDVSENYINYCIKNQNKKSDR